MSILPKGLTIVPKKDNIKVEIIPSLDGGDLPAFVVEVRRLSKEQFVDATSKYKLPPNVDLNSPTGKKLDAKFANHLCKKLVAGWSGLTVRNFEEMFPHSDVEIDAEAFANGEEIDPVTFEIPYSHDLAVYIYRNSWGDVFAGPILNAVKNGTDEEEDEVLGES